MNNRRYFLILLLIMIATCVLFLVLFFLIGYPALRTQAPTPEILATQAVESAAMPLLETPIAIEATQTPWFTPTASPQPTAPCLQAAFLEDVTVADNTVYAPNQDFTKTWRLKNTGSCPWSPSFVLVFESGDQMSAPSAVNLPSNVAPGESVDITVAMKAPETSGVHRGNWMIQSDTGSRFGAGGDPFYVQIEVSFAVVSVSLNANQSRVDAACPMGGTFHFTADVRANGAGSATVHWVRFDGVQSDPITLTFSEAGTQSISMDYAATRLSSGSLPGWVSLYVDEPNHQEMSRLNFELSCVP